MSSPGVKAASAATWSGKWSQGDPPGKKGEKTSGGVFVAAEVCWDGDSVSLSELAKLLQGEERSGKGSADAQMQKLMELLRQSNNKIGELAFHRAHRKPEPKAIPSILGLPVKEAAVKLAHNNLKVKDVRLEYSDNVPAGHVMSQVPVPGSLALTKVGVRLTVSKGAG